MRQFIFPTPLAIVPLHTIPVGEIFWCPEHVETRYFIRGQFAAPSEEAGQIYCTELASGYVWKYSPHMNVVPIESLVVLGKDVEKLLTLIDTTEHLPS